MGVPVATPVVGVVWFVPAGGPAEGPPPPLIGEFVLPPGWTTAGMILTAPTTTTSDTTATMIHLTIALAASLDAVPVAAFGAAFAR